MVDGKNVISSIHINKGTKKFIHKLDQKKKTKSGCKTF